MNSTALLWFASIASGCKEWKSGLFFKAYGLAEITQNHSCLQYKENFDM